MLAGALVALALLAAPEEEKINPAAKKLRIAWASQYEWREDGVKNAVIEFTWTRKYTDRNDQENDSSGTGQVVLVGNETKRIHVDGARSWSTGDVKRGVAWVIARFARKPIEEEFLANAMKKMVKGETIDPNETCSIGCSIKFP